jgi:hypothetical protein
MSDIDTTIEPTDVPADADPVAAAEPAADASGGTSGTTTVAPKAAGTGNSGVWDDARTAVAAAANAAPLAGDGNLTDFAAAETVVKPIVAEQATARAATVTNFMAGKPTYGPESQTVVAPPAQTGP